ncbi:hypothetical protein GCK72_012149 [Caenorhabditis remanei]|uniref:Uncharacterized protein n=1 Tax=Caenorhabditis remanei TaxID=31234 RepID=A0A6A5GMX9_CAERE|nr:hypothetical protein GCK72_012149 [Caenorhabditis remanei]KAF1755699.1 hypothetical protein GCK72_012149 [Caenorhabditis remanei]
MKLLVVFGVFFIFCAQIVNSTPISEQDKKEAIEFFNRQRNNFAKVVPVANMNEIVYDAALEDKYPICEHAKKLQKQDWRVELFTHLGFSASPDYAGIYTPEEAEELAKETGEKTFRDEKWFLNPPHTRLACYYFEKPCTKEDLNGMCIFGGSENVPPMRGLIKGEPGSKCPNGKSEKWENMCKPSSPS